MSGTAVHPTDVELQAFTLGALDGASCASVENHLTDCPSCQARAAGAPADTLVELLRSAHASPTVSADTPAPSVVTATMLWSPTDLSAMAAPAELAGHARYRLLRQLGAGGMGAVWLAEHSVMGRQVALKVIRPEHLARPGAAERFRREVQAAACLHHPNIVTAHDADQAGATHFLVMEYVEGVSLAEHLERTGPLPVAEACRLARDAALGLQHAHEHGLIHRDIKPPNIMLTADGGVKILDFGLAALAAEPDDASRLTGANMVVGTPDYIAPEQAEDAHAADIRSDVYSLGCTLYHMLAGRVPFPGDSVLRKLDAHRTRPPEPIRSLRLDVPTELAIVLARLMAKDPAHRYQTPAEVAAALTPFTGQGVVRLRRRWPLAVAAAVLFAGLAAAAVGVYRVETDKGQLVITTDSDDVEVIIKQNGKEVRVIDTKTDKSITLWSGEYELELKDAGEGLKLNIDKATLKRGETVLATISRAAKPAESGLIGWWRADGNAKDSVGNNHGALKGGVTFAPGVAGQAFDFNGIDGQVNVGNAPSLHLSSEDFSVSAWVNFRSLKHPHDTTDNGPLGDMAIVLKMSPAGVNADGWGLIKQDDDHFWFGFGGGNTNGLGLDYPTMIRSTTSVAPGVWYHVVVVKTSAHFSLYVNGVEEASKPLPAFKDTNNADLLIGAAPGGAHMAGLIDEVTVYSRALSPAEVKARWNALAPATKPVDENVGEVRRFEGHTGDAHCVAYSPDGRYAVSCSGWPTGDRTIRVWEVATGKQIDKFDSSAGQVLCVAFSPDGRRILYGGNGNTAVLLDVATGKEVLRFEDFRDAVLYVVFSPNGRQILAAGQDGFARVFDADTGKELCKFDEHLALNQADGSHKRVMQAAFTPDGKRAVSCGDDGAIYLWDAKTGEKVQSFEGNKGVVNTVAISPDGRHVLTGSWEEDYLLRLWDVATGKLVREFSGHAGGVARVAFSSDGSRAISCSGDKTVRLWDVATGKELHCFTGHTDGVWGVAFSPDDRYALSASQDKTLRLWRLPDPPPAKENP